MTKSSETDKSNRLSADDWLDVALKVLAEQGFQAIAVERLAKTLGVTKGSFYWHFKNRSELVKAVLVFWENIEHQYISDYKLSYDDPQVRLKEILYILIGDQTNRRVFLHLSHSSNEGEINAFYQRAIQRRVGLFAQTYEQMGLSSLLANEKALETYCAYFGLIKLIGDQPQGVLTSTVQARLIEIEIERAVSI